MEDSWYKQLCKDFLSMGSKFIDDKALTELKHNYAFIIDSKRKLEKVKDLESLLKVLEKRDELNAYEIEPLKLISQRYIKNICLQERIKIYEELIKNKSYPDINMYFHSTEHERSDEARGQQESICNSSTSMASQIINPTINLQSGGTRTYDSNYQKYQHLLKEEVVLQLSNRLGRSWRDVGRLLKLRECDITSICMKNSNVQVQSYEALKLGLANYDFDAWKIRLLESLGDARRKDLQEFARDLICK
ncbi:fas-associated death domain protein isoform X2 [Prorops nasuta]|uniref:fas-associated death domain protein isoform X2 n=1 Tax=Prorops nasuta TaxID=863751 RepID=UPI0034CDA63A